MSFTDFGLTESTVSTLIILYSFLIFVLAGAFLFLFFLKGFGIYKMARKKGMENSWYSFVPITNCMIFGAVADKANEKRSGYKNILLFLYIIKFVFGVAFVLFSLLFSVKLLFAADLAVLNGVKLEPTIFKSAIPALICLALTVLLSLFYGILKAVCAAKIYKSFGNNFSVLKAVIGFILPFTFPFFAFSAVKENSDTKQDR